VVSVRRRDTRRRAAGGCRGCRPQAVARQAWPGRGPRASSGRTPGRLGACPHSARRVEVNIISIIGSTVGEPPTLRAGAARPASPRHCGLHPAAGPPRPRAVRPCARAPRPLLGGHGPPRLPSVAASRPDPRGPVPPGLGLRSRVRGPRRAAGAPRRRRGPRSGAARPNRAADRAGSRPRRRARRHEPRVGRCPARATISGTAAGIAGTGAEAGMVPRPERARGRRAGNGPAGSRPRLTPSPAGEVLSAGAAGAWRQVRRRGSRASRRPSPSRLKPRTATTRAAPGKKAMYGAVTR
jgi:hypothetical protein